MIASPSTHQIALEIEGLGKRFDGLEAVRDVSLTIRRGEVVALIGPNGAGKSTLFEMIGGNVKPTKGSIRYFGEDVTFTPAHVRRRSGLCRTYQKIRLFESLTVEQNISVAAAQCVQRGGRGDVVADVMRKLHLAGKAHRLPAELTLADRKKVEIGRAMVGRCDVLLLDESLSGLTHDEADDLVSEILGLNREAGITIMVVEHVMSVVIAMAKRLIVLNQGVLIADGTPEEIAVDARVIEAYFGKKGLAFGRGGAA